MKHETGDVIDIGVLQKLKQVLQYIFFSLRIVEMQRRHPVPRPHPHLHQQQQLQQPLDLIAGVIPEREQHQSGGSGLSDTVDSRRQPRFRRWRSLRHHSQSAVYIISVLSLLFNASVISVVCWWHYKAVCPSAQPHCPDDPVS